MADFNLTLTATDTTTTLVSESTGPTFTGEEIAEIVFRIIIYVVGVVGNLLVIFVILFLNEYRKITHWYVLQLALADLLFLQTLPFRISELVHGRWIHSEMLCQARQTILYFNYYASIMLLMVMAIDRYLAVCHALSTKIQRLRSRMYSYIVTATVWVIAVLLSIPVIMYSALVGLDPDCVCSFDFPKDKRHWCQINYASEGEEEVENCVETTYDTIHGGGACRVIGGESGDINFPFEDSGNLFSGLYFYDPEATDVLVEAPREKRATQGCFYGTDHGLAWHAFAYFNFFVMFILPLIVISTCYTLIVVRLMSTNVVSRTVAKTESNSFANGSSTKKFWKSGRRRSSSTGKTQQEKRRVTLMCAVFVILFVVCWLPFHSVHLARIVGIDSDDSNFCRRLGIAASMVAYLNSALNPYLYNFLGSFQKRMKQVGKHKRMQTFLSATGLTRMGRSSSMANSSDGSRGKRSSVPNESRSASIANERIMLKSMDSKETTGV